MEVPPQLFDFLLNPGLFSEKPFSSLHLGGKLVEVGMIKQGNLIRRLTSSASKAESLTTSW